jgi:hypothetical protein
LITENVNVPWIGTSENLSVNPFLNNPASFAHWMASNGLMPGKEREIVQEVG